MLFEIFKCAPSGWFGFFSKAARLDFFFLKRNKKNNENNQNIPLITKKIESKLKSKSNQENNIKIQKSQNKTITRKIKLQNRRLKTN